MYIATCRLGTRSTRLLQYLSLDRGTSLSLLVVEVPKVGRRKCPTGSTSSYVCYRAAHDNYAEEGKAQIDAHIIF